MSYTNTTINLSLPQYEDSDIPSWTDLNSAFKSISDWVGTVNTQLSSLDTNIKAVDLTDFVKYSASGTGITSNQYSHLTINQ